MQRHTTLAGCILFFWSICVSFAYAAHCPPAGEHGSVRLRGFNSDFVGFVEMCSTTGTWRPISVSRDTWTKKNSITVCRQLGYQDALGVSNTERPSTYSTTQTDTDSTETPLQYNSMECTGLEESLADCLATNVNAESQLQRTLVLCKTAEVSTEGDIRLIGVSASNKEGVVEMYNPRKPYGWSPMCSSEWDDNDAAVACKQLGFQSGKSVLYSSVDLEGLTARKRYNHFECSGSENSLKECDFIGPYPYKCISDYYAGVICEEAEDNLILSLNISLLALMLGVALLLIVILILLLRCTVQGLKRKPSSNRSHNQERNHDFVSSHSRNRIIRARIDSPYTQLTTIAPPSYEQTLLSDQMSLIQQAETAVDVDQSETAVDIDQDQDQSIGSDAATQHDTEQEATRDVLDQTHEGIDEAPHDLDQGALFERRNRNQNNDSTQEAALHE